MRGSELLIIHASQLVTMSGPARPRTAGEMSEIGIIEDGGVLITDGIIQAAGQSDEVKQLATATARVVDAGQCVVSPGFVDPHTHPVFAGTREDEYEMRAQGATYQKIAAEGGGILSTVRRTRAASEEELFRTAGRWINQFLEHGTTTIEAKSGYGLSVEDEIKLLRVIQRLDRETPLDLVPTFLGAHEVPAEYRQAGEKGRESYLRLIVDEMLPRVATDGLARFCDVFCESHVFTVEESRMVLRRASELGLGIRIHADQLANSGGAELAAELHADSADHLDWIEPAAVDRLRAAGVIAVLLPGAVFNLGLSRYPPARMLIDSGVPVALATDFNPGSSPTPSMQMAMSIACCQMHMTPAEAFTASTVNAAYSLRLGDRIGSLETGKQADVVIFDCCDYRQVPYFFGVNHAKTIIKSGRIVFDRREDQV